MGGEFGQWAEWTEEKELDWSLLSYPAHAGIKALVGDLNHLLRSYPAMYAQDSDWSGFKWIDFSDYAASCISFVRLSEGEKPVIWAFNFTPVPRSNYRLWSPLAANGPWREILNTDSVYYGGSNLGNAGELQPEYTAEGQCFFNVTLPPLAAVAFTPQD